MLADLRSLLKVPDNFHIWMMNGGGHLQFSAVPAMLSQHKYGKGPSANYTIGGKWTLEAGKEASKYLNVNYVNKADHSNLKSLDYQHTLNDVDNWTVDKNAEYFYMCQNETIEGIEFSQERTR